jgi:hypothetical protein
MKNGAANDNAASQDNSAERGMVASPISPCSDLDDIAVAAVDLVFPGPALCGLADDLRKIFRAPFRLTVIPFGASNANMWRPWKKLHYSVSAPVSAPMWRKDSHSSASLLPIYRLALMVQQSFKKRNRPVAVLPTDLTHGA